MIIYLNNHYVHACICFKLPIFVKKNDKFRVMCFEIYDASTEGARQKILEMLIDHRNL